MDIKNILKGLHKGEARAISRAISLVEDNNDNAAEILEGLDRKRIDDVLVIGLTGPPGAGKSSLTNCLIKQLRKTGVRVGIVAVDPSSPLSGGALLGDRIRMMDHTLDPNVIIRSMATRGRLGGLCASTGSVVRIMAAAGCRVVIIETVGIGQSEMDIVRLADLTVMVIAPGFGDDIQAMKAGILEVADLLVVNKADKPGIEKLMLDLGPLSRDKEESGPRLLKTVASEDKGVDILLQRLYQLEQSYKAKGLIDKKRIKSFEKETVDWAIEILSIKLKDKASRLGNYNQDPRQAATAIVTDLLFEDTK